jgi:hypothetical protein
MGKHWRKIIHCSNLYQGQHSAGNVQNYAARKQKKNSSDCKTYLPPLTYYPSAKVLKLKEGRMADWTRMGIHRQKGSPGGWRGRRGGSHIPPVARLRYVLSHHYPRNWLSSSLSPLQKPRISLLSTASNRKDPSRLKSNIRGHMLHTTHARILLLDLFSSTVHLPN